MSDRFARFYQPMDRFDFLTLVDHWSTYGITLQNPHTHRVTAISVGGDQVETSPDLLKVTFSNSSPIIFQLWLNEDTDVTSSIRFLSSHRVVEEYELDGLLESEMDRVLEISSKSKMGRETFEFRETIKWQMGKDGDSLVEVSQSRMSASVGFAIPRDPSTLVYARSSKLLPE